MTDNNSQVFKTLNAIDVHDKIERKQNLSYLSWVFAWSEVKKIYPGANYTIWKDENNLPYVYDDKTGYMVYTSVTIEGQTHEMWLPVMDGSNAAMKAIPYEYPVNKWENGRKVEVMKKCDAATMFDINKAIMRCLTKNLAMFGLGLYVYAGEDFPESEVKSATVEAAGERPAARALIDLKIGSDNWEKASKFIATNKQMGFDKIMQQLHRKYTISPATAKQINKLINS